MPTYTSQPDGTAGLDTFLRSSTPTTNNSTQTGMYTGEINGDAYEDVILLKFDFSSIPTGAVITSATLSLWHFIKATANNANIKIYRCLRDWVEAQATWNIFATSNNWGTAGAKNASTDVDSVNMLGSLDFVVAETFAEKQWSLNVTEMTKFFNGTYPNYGFVITPNLASNSNNQYGFRSSDYSVANERPKLVMDYYVSKRNYLKDRGRSRIDLSPISLG